ncbi:AraC family transcriptional regulator [Sphingobium sp. JAI105]|uniref:helix-turn-helix transcriptional regulator n=1 Tax=Sphingobium sp. JAI105 TaxID=2787715 RepID=UPI0018CA9B36|nr:AraC family transcriptional regulator [Sphingobium sp. JAI105]MBG6116608.1 AraC family transcriptional regulator [Sphingobium sp. JAI105]
MDADLELEALRERAGMLGVVPRHICLSNDAALRMASMEYAPFAGEQAAAGYISINMVSARTAPMMRRSRHGSLEGVVRPGTVLLNLPDDGADVRWGACGMLALGIDHNAFGARLGKEFDAARLVGAACRLHRDPLLTSVMRAIWHEGETHGMSNAFIDHSVELLFARLGELSAEAPPRRRERPLSDRQMRDIEAFIQLKLADDLTVADMAALVGRDVAGFSRAFRDASGLAPYQFLTARRMDHAAALLSQGTSVTHAALAVGYSNPSKFADAFRRVRGHLPSQRRNS